MRNEKKVNTGIARGFVGVQAEAGTSKMAAGSMAALAVYSSPPQMTMRAKPNGSPKAPYRSFCAPGSDCLIYKYTAVDRYQPAAPKISQVPKSMDIRGS